MIALLLAAQAAASTPERWSIRTPAEACRSQRTDKDVVVCGDLPSVQRLPLPDERAPPDRPRQATGDYRDNSGGGTPCATTQWGCQVGVKTSLIPVARRAVGLVGNGLAKRPDKSGRIPIPLDDPTPPASRIGP